MTMIPLYSICLQKWRTFHSTPLITGSSPRVVNISDSIVELERESDAVFQNVPQDSSHLAVLKGLLGELKDSLQTLQINYLDSWRKRAKRNVEFNTGVLKETYHNQGPICNSFQGVLRSKIYLQVWER